MAKKAKLMRAYRLKEETILEIERLSEEWNCTHGEVVERAVENARKALAKHDEFGGELTVEYDE